MATETAVKTRPIIFGSPMVRAILGGVKTQTRRVVKVDETSSNGCPIREIVPSLLPNRGDLWDARYEIDNPKAIRCPYGQPGERLRVKETWGRAATDFRGGTFGAAPDEPGGWPVYYRADGEREPETLFRTRWNSPRFMPSWASRITLEITDIRVERLQEMSEEDALADGGWTYANCPFHKAPVHSFADLWDSINAKRGHSWESNCWVWCLSFRRVEAR